MTVIVIHLIFEIADGQVVEFDTEPERTLMEAAKAHDVRGIDADCGGCMACGTCHVVIGPPWSEQLPPQSDMEREMLEYVPNPEPYTRLSCQIALTPQLDGVRVRVPVLQR